MNGQSGESDLRQEATPAPIRLEGIARDFFDGKILRRVLKTTDLEVSSGELTVIAGPSGSGKSTLLTIIGFLLQPSEGRIFIQGREVTRFSSARLATLRKEKIGFVFQQSVLIPALTVLENAILPSAFRESRFRRRSRQGPGSSWRCWASRGMSTPCPSSSPSGSSSGSRSPGL